MNNNRTILFDCPLCGEPMEIGTRMRGRKVECVECRVRVRVPDGGPAEGLDEGLSSNEFLMFGLLFFLIPLANALVSSVLYYTWKKQYPRRANQINLLGFGVFGIHVLIAIAYVAFFKT